MHIQSAEATWLGMHFILVNRGIDARGCPDVTVAKCISVSVTLQALLQPQNTEGLPVTNPLASSFNGDKNLQGRMRAPL